jgi:hypothetical protein
LTILQLAIEFGISDPDLARSDAKAPNQLNCGPVCSPNSARLAQVINWRNGPSAFLPMKSAITLEDASSIEETFRSKIAAIEKGFASNEHRSGQAASEPVGPNPSVAARNEKVVPKKLSSGTRATRSNRETNNRTESASPRLPAVHSDGHFRARGPLRNEVMAGRQRRTEKCHLRN